MKKKITFYLCCGVVLLCLFFYIIWLAFLQNIVSWKWTFFKSYESFSEKVSSCYMTEELPSSAYDIKYYWGNRNFVRIGGYGVCLSSDEYEQTKEEAIQRYQYQYNLSNVLPDEKLYVYDGEQDIKWVTEEYMVFCDIEELELLILAEEQITDYYVLASYNFCGDPINYWDCVLCNDKTGRMIEITKTDRTP